MDIVRTVAVILAVLIVAVIALKVFFFVSSIMMTIFTFLVFAGIVYVLFLIARASLGRRNNRTPQI